MRWGQTAFGCLTKTEPNQAIALIAIRKFIVIAQPQRNNYFALSGLERRMRSVPSASHWAITGRPVGAEQLQLIDDHCTLINSTSKTRVAFGGITPPAPRAP